MNHPIVQSPTTETQVPSVAIDQELQEWNSYYQLLLAGALTQYGGQFVVIHEGTVIAHGTDPDSLRKEVAKRVAIPEGKLVIPFVDNSECITVA